jgi:hypothetical protein
VAIRASSSRQIEALLADVNGGDAVARDAAVARLTVIGARAVDRLLALGQSTAPASARAAAFRALEGIADPRTLPPALAAVDAADAEIAAAAIALSRRFIRGADGARVVDVLTAAALDPRRDDRVRVAAIHALQELGPKTITPLTKSLAADASAAVRAAVQPSPRGRRSAAAEPDHSQAAALREWLAREGRTTPLTAVLNIVERVREREGNEPPARRAEWTAARAAAHLVLARRGSRIALYDLRESLERTTAPLPVDALAALTLVGDASCLEPIASAHARSRDTWWRDHLYEAFQAIVKREKLTSRHAVMKRIAKKYQLATR